MKALILNDVHLGATRTAGTTQETRKQIKQYLQDSLRTLVNEYLDRDLIINGDLFDGFDVEISEVLAAYFTLVDWLKLSGKRVTLVRGNHDIAKNSEKTSSFAFLCSLLQKMYPDQVQVINNTLTMIAELVWCIPHVENQDLFDIELSKSLAIPPSYLLFHANCDNNFAVEADHSLNVSEDWLNKLVKHGHTPVFAHEHQKRDLYAGAVRVLGNQWPSSIADCLSHGPAQKDGTKYAHLLDIEEDFMEKTVSVVLTPTPTWQANGDFVEMNWNDLHETTARFIRVTGEATAEQAADVINLISKYRQQSDAFVISNAVAVAGLKGLDDLSSLSAERLQAVDVFAALCEELNPPEIAAVTKLMEKKPK